jgi:hypothetical protein
MANYIIPTPYISGFENMVKIPDNELEKFAQAISETEIGDSVESIMARTDGLITSFSRMQTHGIIAALISVVEIFENAKRNIEVFSKEFSESYLVSNPEATQEDVETLKRNLSILLKAFDNIRITSKARDVMTTNSANFRDARIISDIRLVFDDDLQESEKLAVVVHDLSIDHYKDGKKKTFFASMDLSDLKKLKDVLDRAILKDSVIREGKHQIKFLDI